MNLHTLCATRNLTAYYDSWNNWLYLEWDGELTLSSVKPACLEIARCFIDHQYPRVLNNNVQLTGIEWDVTGWLARNLFPYLRLAGVKQFAWVHATSLRGQHMAEGVLQQFPAELELALFADVEDAVTWLTKTSPAYGSDYATQPRPAATKAQLVQLVQHFSAYLQGGAVPQ